LIIVAPGFEEIETITVVDILRRSGARVTLAGTEPGPLKGSRDVVIVPDVLLDKTTEKKFDLIVLPGGQPGTTNLRNNPKVLSLITQANENRSKIAAICAAPLVLDSVNLLEKKRFTSHPSIENEFDKEQYSQERVVIDGNLITSRSPGTAMEFAFALVEELFGKDRLETVNKGVMAKL
jgi:protein deglycase